MAKDYDDYEYPENLELTTGILESMKNIVGGEIYEVDQDDEDEPIEEIFLAYERQTKKCRILIDLSWGTPTLQILFINKLGTLFINYNKKIKPSPFKPIPDEWASLTPKEIRLFLGPGLYIDEFPSYLDSAVSTLEKLPENLSDDFLAFMKKYKSPSLIVDSGVITLELKHDIVKTDYVEIIDEMTDELISITVHFEKGDRQVEKRPKVYIEGKAASLSTNNDLIRCSYCNGLIINFKKGVCSQCGASL